MRLELEEEGRASGEGANQTSNNFSGPSNGPGDESGSSGGGGMNAILASFQGDDNELKELYRTVPTQFIILVFQGQS